jgi:hypothetical protein
MIVRVEYKRKLEEQRIMEKQKLSNMLKNLQTSVKTCFTSVESPLERAVLLI